MDKKSSFLVKHLSAFTLFMVYIIMVLIHIISDSFIPEDQLYLIILMLPFLLIGLSLDYILRHNKIMSALIRTVIQLMPLGIFAMMLISSLFFYDEVDVLNMFGYLLWLFISLPFFMTSYKRDGSRQRILHSLIGTGSILTAYLFLTAQTDTLDKKYGAVLILVSYFFMLYTASGIKRLHYTGLVMGIINGAAMIFLRYYPLTGAAQSGGWDIDISGKIEMLIIFTFIFCILVRIYEVIITKEKPVKQTGE